MGKIKNVNKDISNMSLDEKIKLKSQLSKRANVRLKALETNKQENKTYNNTSEYLKQNGRSRFYEGKKVQSESKLNSELSHLTNFLSSKETTLSGIYKKTGTRATLPVNTNYEDIRTMSYADKIKQQKRLSKLANGRLDTLKKNKIDYYSYAMAQHYIEGKGQKYKSGKDGDRFYTGSKFDNERNLNIQLEELTKFVNSKSSTMGGIEKIKQDRLGTFRTERKKNNQVIEALNIKPEDENMFYDFLSSKEFDGLKKYGDSNNIIEDFALAMEKGVPEEQIYLDFQEYKNGVMTIDQVEEKWKIAKWQNKVLQ